ncbi:MAG TPA: nucleotide exchange factor GrpE [Nevskiaceae bacterium]|nr:nucleotide exchange factor GrpE [Nevskiaceae bacterium]
MTDAAADSAPNPGSPADPVTELAALRAELEQVRAAAAQAQDARLRIAAESENVRRRLERDAQNDRKYANEKLLGDLLGIADSLELGLKAAGSPDAQAKAIADGMQLTYRQLMAALEKNGVKQLDPKGEAFNPDAHQAMSMVESAEVKPNHVVEVMQKGYKLHERLLRPAMVVVAKAPAAAS